MNGRPDKLFLRLALAIRERLTCHCDPYVDIEHTAAIWDCCDELVRRIQRARYQGWRLAAQRLRTELGLTVNQMRDQLAVVADQLERNKDRNYVAGAEEIYRDLLALKDEFTDVFCDLGNQLLSVTTEPIVLEGLYLGSFTIELDFSDLKESCSYRIIAQDAQPASVNESVTHPHVQDESLCEGDAKVPIRHALAEGRMLDFFLIVRQTLETYNSASPFVKLEDWHGAYCSDCGGTAADDDRTCCGKCETTVCYDCSRSCEACSSYFCSECVEQCAACDHDVCAECVKSCRECDESFCPNCLTNETCEACHEQQENEESQSSADATVVTV